MLGSLMPKKRKKRTLTIKEAKEHFAGEEARAMIDQDQLTREAIARAEQSGIIFVDEMDKIAGRHGSGSGSGPDVSREGVQRGHPADHRGQYGSDQARAGQNRLYPVHRRRRVSYFQAVGSDSGIARASSDPRRIGKFDSGRFSADSDRARATRWSNNIRPCSRPKG